MAEFSKLYITNRGRQLLTGVMAGVQERVRFTSVRVSDQTYGTGSLETLETLAGIKQECPLSVVEKPSADTIKITATFTNSELETGYYIRTVGLYAAASGTNEEVLYAVCVETSGGCYMPAYNGRTVSGAIMELICTVGNAENVSLEVSPAALVTFAEFQPVMEFAAARLTDEDIEALFDTGETEY